MKTRSLAALLVLALVLAVLPTGSLALTAPKASKPLVVKDGPVEINETNFPDENFRNYVSRRFDTDSNGILSEAEIADVNSINATFESFADLRGIEYFNALENLNCSINQLTELDLSNNSALRILYCNGNQLTELDLSNNPALEELDCSGNQLTELDLSNNPALKILKCHNNQLTELNISSSALEKLFGHNNQLTRLDVSNIPALQVLWCESNQLTELDLSNNPALGSLYCSGNQLTELDISNNPAFEYLDCSGNQLTALDVSNNSTLGWLYCYNNRLTELDVSNNPALERLYCYDNQLTELDVSNNSALRRLDCSGNQLTSLDVSNCENLYNDGLTCENNIYTAAFGEDGTLDLTTLPGSFDVARASNWVGGSMQGNILTLDEGAAMVTYRYDCGMGQVMTFTILVGESTPGIPGDANGDGVVDTLDAVMVMRHALNLITLSDGAAALCDMNGDGEITILDATLIMRAALGF